MVGSTSALDLESISDLIKFDHMYHRTAPPADNEVILDKTGVEMVDCCSVETLEEADVVLVEEDERSETTEGCEEQQYSPQSIVSHVSDDEVLESTSRDAVLPDDVLDFTTLTDNELLELSQNLQQLIDSDQLTMSPTTHNPSITVPDNQQTKSKKTVDNIESLDQTTVVQFADPYSPTVNGWSSPDSTGVGSPFSDDISNNDDFCYQWQESFTELFPALL